MKQQIEALEKAREEKKPAWLSEYELQQRLLDSSPGVAATSAIEAAVRDNSQSSHISS